MVAKVTTRCLVVKATTCWQGGAGADFIIGGLGNDMLYGTGTTDGGASDSEADTLNGADGDDVLLLGNSDIGIGGEGAGPVYSGQRMSPAT